MQEISINDKIIKGITLILNRRKRPTFNNILNFVREFNVIITDSQFVNAMSHLEHL